MKFKAFPEIKTERLFLRKFKELDCDRILFLRSDETINQFIERPESRKTKNKADAIKFIKDINNAFEINKSISWGITLKNDSKIIGTICLWNYSLNLKTAEVGYNLDPKFQNKGIMSEALKIIINYGFNELKFNKIEAFTHKENKNSKKLLKKNRFHLVEERKDPDNKLNIIFEIKNAHS